MSTAERQRSLNDRFQIRQLHRTVLSGFRRSLSILMFFWSLKDGTKVAAPSKGALWIFIGRLDCYRIGVQRLQITMIAVWTQNSAIGSHLSNQCSLGSFSSPVSLFGTIFPATDNDRDSFSSKWSQLEFKLPRLTAFHETSLALLSIYCY